MTVYFLLLGNLIQNAHLKKTVCDSFKKMFVSNSTVYSNVTKNDINFTSR